MKTCNKCNQDKPFSEFNKDKSRKDGHYSYCKPCTQEIKYARKGIFIENKEIDGVKVDCKNCASCGEFKPFSDFPFSTKGLRNTIDDCEVCRVEILEERAKSNRERAKKYRESNPKKVAAQKKDYYERNKEKISNYGKRHYLSNKERYLIASRKWKQENIERWREYHSQYEKEYYSKKENYLRRLKTYEKYRESHQDKIKTYKASVRGREVNNRAWQKRRALEEGQSATLTKDEWEVVIQKFDSSCCYCGEKRKLTREHFIPVSKGGGFTYDNILPSCGPCNSSKNNKDFNDWYSKQPFYSRIREEKIINHLNESAMVQPKENAGM